MKNKRKKNIELFFLVFLVAGIFLLFQPALAQYQNQEKIPGAEKQQTEFVPYLQDIIKFGFAVIGILALFMLVIGAYQYLIASGTGNVSGAKETIASALLGLILGVCAYIILQKINPDLVNMRGITKIQGTGAGQTGPAPVSPTGNVPPATNPNADVFDKNSVKCPAVRNYSGFMDRNYSDGLFNETKVASAEDLRNVIANFRTTERNDLTKYANLIYEQCKTNHVPFWYAIGTFAHESSMFSEYGADGKPYGCTAARNPGCIHDKDTDEPKVYDTPEQGIQANIENMGRRVADFTTPLGTWNKWYWPDRSDKNCAEAQSYLDKFDTAARATGVSGI